MLLLLQCTVEVFAEPTEICSVNHRSASNGELSLGSFERPRGGRRMRPAPALHFFPPIHRPNDRQFTHFFPLPFPLSPAVTLIPSVPRCTGELDGDPTRDQKMYKVESSLAKVSRSRKRRRCAAHLFRAIPGRVSPIIPSHSLRVYSMYACICGASSIGLAKTIKPISFSWAVCMERGGVRLRGQLGRIYYACRVASGVHGRAAWAEGSARFKSMHRSSRAVSGPGWENRAVENLVCFWFFSRGNSPPNYKQYSIQFNSIQFTRLRLWNFNWKLHKKRILSSSEVKCLKVLQNGKSSKNLFLKIHFCIQNLKEQTSTFFSFGS